jgi:hypothetical protein
MLRLQTSDGWWLVTHPHHAHLAGDFASHWGNDLFARPEPREHVLRGIYAHDDGWRARDEHPVITRQGKPAAFSTELVGAYSAFEEIDLEAYLGVRRSAVNLIASEDPYAAILISMHTHNLLSARADRSTIRPEQLALLDAFLDEQRLLQEQLQNQIATGGEFSDEESNWQKLTEHFRILQATDDLSLLSCVDFRGDATLLHPLPATSGDALEVKVEHIGERSFRLTPYPLDQPALIFHVPARFVPGGEFNSSEQLQAAFAAAPVQQLDVRISA